MCLCSSPPPRFSRPRCVCLHTPICSLLTGGYACLLGIVSAQNHLFMCAGQGGVVPVCHRPRLLRLRQAEPTDMQRLLHCEHTSVVVLCS